jgi:hypothetical protein
VLVKALWNKSDDLVVVTMSTTEARWLLGICRRFTQWELLVYNALKKAGL